MPCTQTAVLQALSSYLARPVHIVCDAVLFQRRHSSVVRALSNMVCSCAAAIDLLDASFVCRLVGKALEDPLSHCRPTNVAEADEENGNGRAFGHGRGA